MGFFTYNYFKNRERPVVYLAYPDKRTIGAIHTYDLQTDIMANSANTGSFTTYRYEDGEETKFYNDVEIGKYIQIFSVGWFRITEVSIVNEGVNESKEINIISIESELGQTNLTSFGSMGTDDDEQGGLDRYCLYSITDTAHSIMHIVIQKNPGWSIRYIDPQITTEYRSFQDDSIDTYSFLTGKVAEAFECVFQFDDYERSISAYKLENLGKDTGIILNYHNVIKSIKMDSNEDNVKSVLTVVGGNDGRTNTPLGIYDVNISGTNQIYDFSYFLPMMSQELQDGLTRYDELCKTNESAYQEKMSTLLSHYKELNTLKNKLPDDKNSTDWTLYGLVELKVKEKIYKQSMSSNINDSESETYKKNVEIHAAIEAEIKVREQQIKDKESEIKSLNDSISALVVNLPDVLGEELYKELGPYVREDTLTDDSFIVTDIMTDHEILEMQQELLKHGISELHKVTFPQFTLDVDLVNFTVNYDYKRFTDALEMFNIIHINFEDCDSIISVRLLKLHINWDNPSDFKATFSNRNSLKETWNLIEEIRNQTENASSKVEFTTGAWKNAATVSVDVSKYMNNVLDASKQQLITNDNNEIEIDTTGIMCKKWLPEQQTYDPAQLWITANMLAITMDEWNTVGLAIGYVKMGDDNFFGVCAPSIVGNLLMSKKLIVSNESGSYIIDKDGFIAKKDAYEVKINPDTPDNIFSISIDSKKLLYVDSSAKALTFEGKLISKSGQIASFNINDNTLISGNIGLCSDTSAGAVAFWAGNADRNVAPFRVTNAGGLVCTDATITGGKITWGAISDGDKIVTSITKNTVTTEYVNALSVKAGSVDAENITGTTITGKTIRAGKIIGNVIEGSAISGGSLDIGNLSANDSSLSFADFSVNSLGDKGSILQHGNFWIKPGPAGMDSAMKIYQINCDDDMYFPNSPWSDGMGALEMLKDLYDKKNEILAQIDRLSERISNLGG